MKKAEAEPAIRSLASKWFDTLPLEKREHPSFGSFKAWLSENHFSHYLTFRSSISADYDAEMWFDDELSQNWRR